MSVFKGTWVAVSAPVVLAMAGYLVGSNASDANAAGVPLCATSASTSSGASNSCPVTGSASSSSSGYYGGQTKADRERQEHEDEMDDADEHVKELLGQSKKKKSKSGDKH